METRINEFENFINKELGEVLKKITPEKNKTLEYGYVNLKVTQNNKDISVIYDIANKCEAKKDDINKNMSDENYTCGLAYYDNIKAGFYYKKIIFFHENKKHFLSAYLKNDILYISSIYSCMSIFFPCPSGIPDSKCIKDAKINHWYEPHGWVLGLDFHNNEFLFTDNNKVYGIYDKYGRKHIDFFLSKIIGQDFIYLSDKKEIDEKINNIPLHVYFKEACSKIPKTKTPLQIVKEQLKDKFNINMDKIPEAVKKADVNRFRVYTDIGKEKNYEIKCMNCNKTSVINIEEKQANTMFPLKIECPSCHNVSDFYNEKRCLQNIEKTYLQLTPDKNILVTVYNSHNEKNSITSIFQIFSGKVETVFLEKKHYHDEKIVVNNFKEIKEIFDNSNIAYLNIPDILGLTSAAPEKQFLPLKEHFFSMQNLTFSSDTILNVIQKLFQFPFLLKDIEKYGYENIKSFFLYKDESEKYSCLSEMTGLSYENMDILKEKNIWFSSPSIVIAKKIIEERPEENIMQIIDCLYNKNVNKILGFANIFSKIPKKYSFFDVIEYFDSCKLHQGLDMDDALNIYIDYLKMAVYFEYNLEKKSIAFPDSLKKQHNIVCSAYNKIDDKEVQEKFSINFSDNMKKFNFTDKKYCVILPGSPIDIVKEGKEQMHCIASYIEKIEDGKSIIFFIRKSDTPDKSLYAAEFIPGTNEITQIKGKGNKNPDEPEVLEFIDKWLKKKDLVWRH